MESASPCAMSSRAMEAPDSQTAGALAAEAHCVFEPGGPVLLKEVPGRRVSVGAGWYGRRPPMQGGFMAQEYRQIQKKEEVSWTSSKCWSGPQFSPS